MNVLIVLLMGVFTGWCAYRLIEGHGLGSAGDISLGVLGAFFGTLIYSNISFSHHSILGSFSTALGGALFFLVPLGVISAIVRSFKSQSEGGNIL